MRRTQIVEALEALVERIETLENLSESEEGAPADEPNAPATEAEAQFRAAVADLIGDSQNAPATEAEAPSEDQAPNNDPMLAALEAITARLDKLEAKPEPDQASLLDRLRATSAPGPAAKNVEDMTGDELAAEWDRLIAAEVPAPVRS